MSIAQLRKVYHQRICKEIIRLQKDGITEYPNFADKGNKASRAISHGIVRRFGYNPFYEKLSGQTTGVLFETITKDFLEKVLHFCDICVPENGIIQLCHLFQNLTSTSIWPILKR